MTAGELPLPDGSRGTRGWFWLQLAIGWLPVWALYATMMVGVHGGPVLRSLVVSGRAIAIAALLGIAVLRVVERLPWPRPVRPGFVLVHLVAAVGYALSWVLLTSLVESVFRGRFLIVSPPGILPFAALGIWLYVAVAGVSYAVRATERAARAEASAVRSQLAALRGQLNPHFLFNALHTVVQLIPDHPERAADAAERLAGLLRIAIEEDRDLVPLAEERAFVERYLDIEALRFGERLEVRFAIGDETAGVLVPAFVLQTLVENAVRHGVAPRVEPTQIDVVACTERRSLRLEVRDTGAGAASRDVSAGDGTGLRRLRERLEALYGSRASLHVESNGEEGFTATVTIPLERGDEAP